MDGPQPSKAPPARVGLVGLRSDAGPLGDVALKFGPEVTALYGRNGAGKSWILRALEAALKGIAVGETQIILEWPDVENSSYRGGLPWESDETGRALELPTLIRNWFAQGGRFYNASFDEFDLDGLVAELSRSPYYALVPSGTLSQRWDVWVCADLDPERARHSVIHRGLLLGMTMLAGSAAQAAYQLEIDPPVGEDLEANMLLVERVLDFGEFLLEPETTHFADNDFLEEWTRRIKAGEPWDDNETANLLADWVLHQAAANWLNLPAAGWAWDRPYTSGDAEVLDTGGAAQLTRMCSDGLPMPLARVAVLEEFPHELLGVRLDGDIDALTAKYPRWE